VGVAVSEILGDFLGEGEDDLVGDETGVVERDLVGVRVKVTERVNEPLTDEVVVVDGVGEVDVLSEIVTDEVGVTVIGGVPVREMLAGGVCVSDIEGVTVQLIDGVDDRLTLGDGD